jgi:putative ABC transport system permease protein
MIKNYIKIAWRNLTRNKAYAAINVIGLALGVTCGLLIFTLVTYHLSFDTFHLNKDRIYRVVTEFKAENIEYQTGVPQPLGKAFRNDYAFAEKVAMVKSLRKMLISLPDGKEVKKFNEKGNVAFAEPAFFDILNFPLIDGNEKTALSEPNTAIITQRIAKKYFGDENPMGKILLANNKTEYKITGVLKDIPANTDRKEEIYLSYQNLKDEYPAIANDNSWRDVSSSLQCFVLLKPNVAMTDVDNAFPAFTRKHYKAEDAKVTVFKLQPLSDIHFNKNFNGDADMKHLWAFSLIGLFLIITACVNFINLATAQALGRAKEVGVRKVMGGLPKQLFWQFIAETALITFFAVAIAYVLAKISLPYLNTLLGTKMQLDIFSNIQTGLFLGILTFLVIFLSGSYPGLVLARFKPVLALKGKLSQKHIGGFSLRRILVITQFAISQVLIIGTIVIAAQMNFSKTTDLGFNKDGIVLLPVPSDNKVQMNSLKTRLATIAGVKSVSLCFQPPAAQSDHYTNAHYDNRPKDELWELNQKNADAQYIQTFGLKLVAGRNMFPSDTAREFLVNETVVKKLNLRSPQDIIGKMFRAGGVTAPVVGVVKDFYNASFHEDIAPIAMTSSYLEYNNCAVKVDLHDIKSTLSAFEKTWNETYPDQLFSYQFLDQEIAEFYDQDNMMLKLIEAFACIAILIGCLGLYGLISFMAMRKTKEIGVRKVLGASVGNIIWLFGKEFSTLLLVAFIIAAPLALLAMHSYLQDFKYRIQLGPGIFLIAIASTFLIASLTVGYRSIKAALTNPVKSLRSE